MDTSRAAEELTTAHEYQRKAGRRAACLMLILIVVVAIVLLAVRVLLLTGGNTAHNMSIWSGFVIGPLWNSSIHFPVSDILFSQLNVLSFELSSDST